MESIIKPGLRNALFQYFKMQDRRIDAGQGWTQANMDVANAVVDIMPAHEVNALFGFTEVIEAMDTYARVALSAGQVQAYHVREVYLDKAQRFLSCLG